MTIKIKVDKVLELLGEVLIPYFCDRFLNKFEISTLEAKRKMCAKLKNKVYHKTIYEIYELFIKYYINKFSYTLDSDRYQHDESDSKSPGLVSEISVWIHNLMAEISIKDERIKQISLKRAWSLSRLLSLKLIYRGSGRCSCIDSHRCNCPKSLYVKRNTCPREEHCPK